MHGETVDEVRRHAAEFARENVDLPLYSRLANGLADDEPVASLLLSARAGQARPVLLLAALHDLVLQHPDLPAARWYPSVTGAAVAPEGDPWPDVRAAALEHADRLRAVIATRSTQTNEVNRSAYVSALTAAAAADRQGQPVALLEVGASAGLLLNHDRYRLQVRHDDQERILGAVGSAVVCHTTELTGDLLPAGRADQPVITSRTGLDADPIDLDDADGRRWLEACLWPDQPERLERLRAAIRETRDHPPTLIRGDMVKGLRAAADVALRGSDPAHLVVLTSWAATYLPPAARLRLVDALTDIAAGVDAVSLVSAEPPGVLPGLFGSTHDHEPAPSTTVLGLHRWRGGAARSPQVVGTAHPHGAWLSAAQLAGS